MHQVSSLLQLLHVLSTFLADQQLIAGVKVLLIFMVKLRKSGTSLWVRFKALICELRQRRLKRNNIFP